MDIHTAFPYNFTASKSLERQTGLAPDSQGLTHVLWHSMATVTDYNPVNPQKLEAGLS